MNPLLAALAAQRRFVLYKLVPLENGKSDKIPIDPATGLNTSAQNTAGWMIPTVAMGYAAMYGDSYGVGIALREPCGLFFIDIDSCIDAAGTVSELARNLVSAFSGCYVEYSPSGRGLHIFGSYTGEPPNHSCKNIPLHIELYTSGRFMTTTGRTYQDGSPLFDATNQLLATTWTHFQPKQIEGADGNQEWTTEDDPACTITGTDEERVALARRTKSIAAKFAPNKITFEDLWTANAEKLGRAWPSNDGTSYDASSADQALANHVAFYFANNCESVERVMRLSPLTEQNPKRKWDGSRPDYVRSTILNAVAIPKRWRPSRTSAAPILAAAPQAPAPIEAPPPPRVGDSTPVIPAPPATMAPPPPSALPEAIPEALFTCTDQANAERLQRTYGAHLIAVAGDFYAWDGRRWKLDDGLAQRFACDLSRIVNEERKNISIQYKKLQDSAAEGHGDALMRLETELKALSAWAVKCEMKSTQESALGMLRKLLNVPVEKIDSNPWLLNVENGTIDLKTGKLRAHASGDLITKVAPSVYDASAECPRFKQFLVEIFQGDEAVAQFLQRWYGYSATGDAREQKLLIKHGPGGNGKSTLGDAIDAVLGEYSSPATMGLLTGKAGAADTAHLAEIAGLRGQRLVTASESEDGAKLKEALIKQLTGGDALKGKRLYGQLFSFRPTHKLELLTNHKPVIKGSDFSIWRRIMLLNFPVKYGSAAEVASGEAMAVRDPTLGVALRAETSGILAWIVEGARLWLAQGLTPPRSMLDASADYRQSQDHVAEFLTECCTVDPSARQPLPVLYSAYKAWCNAAGRDHPITRQRLVDELERRVPKFVRPDMARRTAQGTYVTGLMITPPVPPPPR